MNQARFNEAQKAYDAGDYRAALQGFLDAVERSGGANGQACHMAGNCALKLRRYSDAETAYRRALLDDEYVAKANVHTNLGVALAAEGDYTAAIAEFEKAITEEPEGAFKAHQGRGSALLRCGRVKDAAYAFRTAASDLKNPDPGRALVNLGVCFMAMDRPGDAVEAYRAAVNLPSYKGKGKAAANLGQAFVADGRFEDAVRAFRQAEERWGQKLSTAAAEDYRIAREAVEGATAANPVEPEPVQPVAFAAPEPTPIDMPSADANGSDDPDVTGRHAPLTPDPEGDPFEDVRPTRKHAETGGIPVAVETDFFDATEAELRSKDRQVRKEKRREGRFAVKLTLAVLGLLILGTVAAGGFYALGFGYPGQSATLDGLVTAHAVGEDVSPYWVARPRVDIVRAMMALPPTDELTVESLDRSATASTAIVALKLESGTPVRYKVTFAREGVGWKVSDVEAYFASTEPAAGGGGEAAETVPAEDASPTP